MPNKVLTPENWKALDPVFEGLFNFTPRGVEAMVDQDVAELVLSVDLNALTHVPEGPRELLQSAQGVMVYGALYYPLLTVGVELCGRSGEAALKARAQQVGIELWEPRGQRPPVQMGYARLAKVLEQAGHIPNPEWWAWAREHRNWASHPEGQSVVTLPMAIDVLRSYAEGISALFPT